MEIETAQSPKTKMKSLRSICDREVRVHQQNLDSSTALFPTSLHFIKALAQDAAQAHVKLAKLKANLREAEDELVKVLAAKTRKEAKQMATRDSISAIKARVEEFKRTVQVQKARRDEYESIISQESLGVKFTFNDMNIENPKQEYSLTIRHANDAYSLLDCDPPLNGIGELINELNRTNGLFKFVRIMREKFQEAAALGLQPQSRSFRQGSSAISMSCPALSVSTDISESSTKKNEHRVPLQEVNRQIEEVNYRSKSPSKATENKFYDGRFNRYSKKPN
ncbi:hypothetical protein CXB51_022951 [Gossypium anomalum]|uniref:Kinetochore protein SPC25 n=1 Tax=Gossypium anomalum TaxID=47600 RepID=A0A8J5YWJ8_9ROSI|nr:hypothetical protein CXB51_022951 [Gossypium anomalum]